jgi:hypothetical protein
MPWFAVQAIRPPEIRNEDAQMTSLSDWPWFLIVEGREGEYQLFKASDFRNPTELGRAEMLEGFCECSILRVKVSTLKKR